MKKLLSCLLCLSLVVSSTFVVFANEGMNSMRLTGFSYDLRENTISAYEDEYETEITYSFRGDRIVELQVDDFTSNITLPKVILLEYIMDYVYYANIQGVDIYLDMSKNTPMLSISSGNIVYNFGGSYIEIKEKLLGKALEEADLRQADVGISPQYASGLLFNKSNASKELKLRAYYHRNSNDSNRLVAFFAETSKDIAYRRIQNVELNVDVANPYYISGTNPQGNGSGQAQDIYNIVGTVFGILGWVSPFFSSGSSTSYSGGHASFDLNITENWNELRGDGGVLMSVFLYDDHSNSPAPTGSLFVSYYETGMGNLASTLAF